MVSGPGGATRAGTHYRGSLALGRPVALFLLVKVSKNLTDEIPMLIGKII